MIYRREILENELKEGMQKSLAGNKPAYEEFLKKVGGLVRGYLTNSLSPKSRTDQKVEDLVQDVLVAIHRKKHLYRSDMPILPWLFAVARYRLIDHFRSDQRRPALTFLDETMDPADPAQSATTAERAFELEELMECLSPRQRDILVLAKAEGVPLAEIAEKFRMTVPAVKITIHRALLKVRQRLEPRVPAQ